jgi:hypothetical protein
LSCEGTYGTYLSGGKPGIGRSGKISTESGIEIRNQQAAQDSLINAAATGQHLSMACPDPCDYRFQIADLLVPQHGEMTGCLFCFLY